MDLSKLQRGEFVALHGGVLLLAGLFLDWYATKGRGDIDGIRGSQSGWEVHTIIRWSLVAAALAPFVLAYIIVRDHALRFVAATGTLLMLSGLARRASNVERKRKPPGML